MRVVHQRCVPNESEHEEENERRDECEKEFLPIHNFFLLRFAAAQLNPRISWQERRRMSTLNFQPSNDCRPREAVKTARSDFADESTGLKAGVN
jgi:hypothetical protein